MGDRSINFGVREIWRHFKLESKIEWISICFVLMCVYV